MHHGNYGVPFSKLLTMRGGQEKTEMLTCSTVRAAFPIRYSSISTGDHRTGDLATHSSRVLQEPQMEYMINYIDINRHGSLSLLCCSLAIFYIVYCTFT